MATKKGKGNISAPGAGIEESELKKAASEGVVKEAKGSSILIQFDHPLNRNELDLLSTILSNTCAMSGNAPDMVYVTVGKDDAGTHAD